LEGPWDIIIATEKKPTVTLQRRVMIQNLSNLAKKLPPDWARKSL
jgi:hypothetical protein